MSVMIASRRSCQARSRGVPLLPGNNGRLRAPIRWGDTAADNDEAATPRFIPGPLLCAYRMAMNDLVIPRNRSRSIIASGKRVCISVKLSNSASSTATMASSSVAAFE